MLVMSYGEQPEGWWLKPEGAVPQNPARWPSGSEDAGGRRGGRVDGGAGVRLATAGRRSALGPVDETPLLHVFPLEGCLSCTQLSSRYLYYKPNVCSVKHYL